MHSSSAAPLLLLLAVSCSAAAAAVGTPDVPVAFAATGIAGLYRSTDLFATATLVLPSFVNKVVATKDATTGNNVLYAAGGAVWKSVDNGQTWKQTYATAHAGLIGIVACDAQRVVAAEVVIPNDQGKGNYEVLLSTADGGATWTPSKHLNGTYVLTLGGDATMVGALAANLSDHTIHLELSTDCGATFKQVPSFTPEYNKCCDLQNGFDGSLAVSASGELAISGFFNATQFSPKHKGKGVVFSTKTGGAPYTLWAPPVPAAVEANSTFGTTIYGSTFVGSTAYVAAGAIFTVDDNDGFVARSTDGGVTWSTLMTTKLANLHAIDFGSGSQSNYGCVVGRSQTKSQVRVMCTRDGGSSWSDDQALPLTHGVGGGWQDVDVLVL